MIVHKKLAGFVNPYLAVGIGSAIGGILRFAISEWIGTPQGTFVVNSLGSLLLGVCMAALAQDLISRELTILIGSGILGAFTTVEPLIKAFATEPNVPSKTPLRCVALTLPKEAVETNEPLTFPLNSALPPSDISNDKAVMVEELSTPFNKISLSFVIDFITKSDETLLNLPNSVPPSSNLI